MASQHVSADLVKVLVADDDEDIRNLMKTMLKMQGCTMTVADHGEDALNELLRVAGSVGGPGPPPAEGP